MGKGDRRSKRGKIWKGTFGVNRPRLKTPAYTGDAVEEVVEAPKKKAPARKPAAKKAAPKTEKKAAPKAEEKKTAAKKAPAKKPAAKKDTAAAKKETADAKKKAKIVFRKTRKDKQYEKHDCTLAFELRVKFFESCSRNRLSYKANTKKTADCEINQ